MSAYVTTVVAGSAASRLQAYALHAAAHAAISAYCSCMSPLTNRVNHLILLHGGYLHGTDFLEPM